MRMSQALTGAVALILLASQPAAAKDPETDSKPTAAATQKGTSGDDKAAKNDDDAKKAGKAGQTTATGNNAAGTGTDGSVQSMAIEDTLPGEQVSAPVLGSSAPAPSASDLWIPAALAILLAALFAGLVGWLLGRKIKGLESSLEQLREKVRGQGAQIADLRSESRPAGGSDYASRDRGHVRDEWAEEPRPAPPPPPPPAPVAPAPAPRVSRLPELLDQIRQDVSTLILSPGLRSNEYDAALARFGTVYGIEIDSEARTARLVPADADPGRRLSAIHLADEDVAVILPSSRYVKEFAMTFKESLEAGADVKKVFDCRVDGSGTLKLVRPAQAKVDAALNIVGLNRGEIAGFVG